MSKTPDINDCFLHDKDRLRHSDALDLLRSNLPIIAGTESIPLSEGLGRILAETLVSPHDVPLHTNAAVDGYAFARIDLGDNALPVSSRIAAGDLNPPALEAGCAARIFTGATMPEGADTVAMQEDCATTESSVELPAQIKRGANCRSAGEDLKAGEAVLNSGTRLNPADLAAIASTGLARLPTRKKLTVTLLSSGNELRRIGDDNGKLKAGQVWDANAPLLSALLASLPVNLIDGGVVGDTREATQTAIAEAAQNSDIIITTGGASRGREDHMLTVLDELGRRHLWQLAVKPGRPMMFGQIARTTSPNDCFFFGLPGNPVAAMVCFLLYTRPSLLQLVGANWEEPFRYKVPAAFSIENKKPDRREFLRGILQHAGDGTLTVKKFERDGSGLISSLREADGLIEIDEETTSIQRGDLINFLPFSSLF